MRCLCAHRFHHNAGIGEDADGFSGFHQLLRGKQKGVEPGLLFNPLEFEWVKMGVVQGFPYSKEFDGVPIPQPIRDEGIDAPIDVFMPLTLLIKKNLALFPNGFHKLSFFELSGLENGRKARKKAS